MVKIPIPEIVPQVKSLLHLLPHQKVEFIEIKDFSLIERWLSFLGQALLKGGINNNYPDPVGIVSYLDSMRPSHNKLLVAGDEVLKVHSRSGLPILAEFTNIQERKNSAKNERVSNKEPDEDFFIKLLLNKEFQPLFQLTPTLKFKRESTLTFDVNLDRFDPVSNRFVRYQVRLTQENTNQNSSIFKPVSINKQNPVTSYSAINANLSSEFRHALSIYSWLDSELGFFALSSIKGINVEGVSRGAIGPFYYGKMFWGDTDPPFTKEWPESTKEIIKDHPNSFWLTLPVDRVDVTLKEDQDNDPFSLPLSKINPKMYNEIEKHNQNTGVKYGTRRNTIFVVSDDISSKVIEFCKKRGCNVTVLILEGI